MDAIDPTQPARGAAAVRVSADTLAAVRAGVERGIVDDVHSTLRGRRWWRKAGNAFEATSKAMHGASTVLAFAAGVFSSKETSFAAGTVGTLGLVLLAFASYAAKESRERTAQLNSVLHSLGLDPVPDIAVPPAADDDADATGGRPDAGHLRPPE